MKGSVFYHLTTLYNLVCNVISKIMVHQIRSVFYRLIQPTQGAFQKVRTSGTMCKVNEIVNSKKFWRKGCFMKLGVERLREKFQEKRLLMQEDSMYPYLFLMVMEIFNRCILKDLKRKTIKVPKIVKVRQMNYFVKYLWMMSFS